MKLSITQRATAAFSLVEVALAMGVASFCLVAVLGLVPLGIDTNLKASDQTACSSILTHVLADLRATPTTSPPGGTATSTEYGLVIPAHGAASTAAVTLKPLYFGSTGQQFSYSPTTAPVTARYRLTVTFLPSVNIPVAGATDRTASRVTLLVSWPPIVDPNDPTTGRTTGRVQMMANLDRN